MTVGRVGAAVAPSQSTTSFASSAGALAYNIVAVYEDGTVCISILHAPGDDPSGYEQVHLCAPVRHAACHTWPCFLVVFLHFGLQGLLFPLHVPRAFITHLLSARIPRFVPWHAHSPMHDLCILRRLEHAVRFCTFCMLMYSGH